MNNESTFQKIIRKTGRKPSECKCEKCQNQCRATPCLGTPDDIEKIIDAGFGHFLTPVDWRVGKMLKVLDHDVDMVQAYNVNHHGCIFFQNGLCQLHDKGLKPTEGRLSHHTTLMDNFDFQKSLSFNIAKEWELPENQETIARIKFKLNFL